MSNPQNRQFIEMESSNLAQILAQGQTHAAADRLRQDYMVMVGGNNGRQNVGLEGQRDFQELVRAAQGKEQALLMQASQPGYGPGGGYYNQYNRYNQFPNPAHIAEERVQVQGGYQGYQGYQGQPGRTMMDVRVFGPDERGGDPRYGSRNIVIDVGLVPIIYGGPMRGDGWQQRRGYPQQPYGFAPQPYRYPAQQFQP